MLSPPEAIHSLLAYLRTRRGLIRSAIVALCATVALLILAQPLLSSTPDRYTLPPFSITSPLYSDTEYQPQSMDEWNHRSLRDLHVCTALRNCGQNQTKVVLFAGRWFEEALIEGWRGGEGVWAVSMEKALRSMGYTTLMAADDWKYILAQYRLVPDNIRIVITPNLKRCIEDKNCIKNEDNPTGIPRWKYMSFFPSNYERQGDLSWEWVIHADRNAASSADEPFSQYIGYSLNSDCASLDHMIPLGRRNHTAWFFAKQATYAYLRFPLSSFPRDYFQRAITDLSDFDLTFRGAYQINEHYFSDAIVGGPLEPIPGVDNIGRIGPLEFAREISSTRILVGIGQPSLSPTPYLGLCLGTPFLNPIMRWDEKNPGDKRFWESQHSRLRWLDPPYVYNVRAADYEGFLAAIKSALTEDSITPWHDPEQTEEGIAERMGILVEKDFESMARELRRTREAEGATFKWDM